MNASRVHLDAFVAQAALHVGSGDLVLDAGAGHGPYTHHFAHARYESADFQQVEGKTYGQIDYVCDLAQIPVEHHRYSLVLLNQVLEHLPKPGSVLAELRRVLKPDGEIWASTPLFYEEHDTPYDFYRYTQFGLRHLFEHAGFRDVRIAWLEGYLGTVSYELDVAARAVGGGVKAPLRRALWLASGLAARADVRRKRTDIGHPKNYTIVATA